MITIRGYHGYLDDKRSAKLDKIAMVVQAKFEWQFNGTVGEFSEKWDEKFLYYPHPIDPIIFVTFRTSFSPA